MEEKTIEFEDMVTHYINLAGVVKYLSMEMEELEDEMRELEKKMEISYPETARLSYIGQKAARVYAMEEKAGGR